MTTRTWTERAQILIGRYVSLQIGIDAIAALSILAAWFLYHFLIAGG